LRAGLLDIDYFKAFNDRHGHPAGDELLRGSARAWRDELRITDQLGRYGGDELILLLSGCALHSGRDLIGRLAGLTGGGQTCSAGIAEWDRQESGDDLVTRADVALLDAKQSGRNRVISAV
jgi:diguanylate cyclase (GGDEF)-like protein